jgi:hypothetical protein
MALDRQGMTMLPRPHVTRRWITVACVAVATLGASAPASPARSQDKPLGACTVRPTEDSLPSATPLLEAWRMRDGVSQILHDVHCSDGRVDRVWIAADII